jgi:hypothetical protein
MVRSEEVNERIAKAVEMAAEVEKDKPKKKKKHRNKSGLISRTPIQIMQASDFNNLVNQNSLYKNILITYIKTGLYDGLPVDEKLSLYDIQRFYKRFIIVKKTGTKLNVVARTKSGAIENSKTPKRDILHIIRVNRDGKEAYLKHSQRN